MIVKSPKAVKNELIFDNNNGKFIISIENRHYTLDETQYKAILRKRDMPIDRLEKWLKSYSDENN